jgi:hypothetical protein
MGTGYTSISDYQGLFENFEKLAGKWIYTRTDNLWASVLRPKNRPTTMKYRPPLGCQWLLDNYIVQVGGIITSRWTTGPSH